MTESIGLMDILIIAGITQGLFFTFLLFKNRKNRYANRFMAMLGITVTLLIAFPLINQTPLFSRLPLLFIYLICSPLLIPPFIFLYTRFLISPTSRFRISDGSHFLIFLGWFIFLSIKHMTAPNGIFEYIRTNHIVLKTDMWINILQSITYHIYILYLLKQYSRDIRESFSSIEKISLNWLKTMAVLGVAFGFFMLLTFAVGPMLDLPEFDSGVMITLAMIMMLFVISYLAIRQPEIFQVAVDAKTLRKKYQTSGLSSEKSKKLKKSLLQTMERDKPYLNSLLSINDLARKLEVPPWYVSQVINEKFNQNYFDFINKYRVAEAKKQLADPSKTHLSILDIAYDAGFNSKSTFNTAFKKYHNTTPSHFRKQKSQQSA